MRLTGQNNPYCGFKDDKERRLALNVRARWYASAAIAVAFAGSNGALQPNINQEPNENAMSKSRLCLNTLCQVTATLLFAAGANVAKAAPTITEYAKCSGILIVAAALTKSADPAKSNQYLNDAKTLETKASKLKGFDQGTYMEMAFDSQGGYLKMLNSGAASPTGFWSDAGYCRGLAQ
jgi:hypothetical protein